MITANIKDAKRYFGVNPNFEKAFEFLKTLNKDSDTGAFEFDGFKGSIVAFDASDTTPDGEQKPLEAHREYLDIHYVLNGSEAIGYADIDTLEGVTDYDAEGDYILLKGDMYKVYLKAGDFCIVFPEDAHAPTMHAFDSKAKKAIVKIRV